MTTVARTHTKLRLVESLITWMTFVRQEQAMTLFMNVSYLPDETQEYRRGRADGLRLAESTLGLLAFEQGVDLRDAPLWPRPHPEATLKPQTQQKSEE